MQHVLLYDFSGNDWLLTNESSSLLDVMNEWVEQQGNTEEYSQWRIDETILSNLLPVLSCFFGTLDIEENNKLNGCISVYPNPAREVVTIDGLECSNIQICNTFGQTVKTAQNTNEISVSDLPEGFYLLRMMDNKGMTASKKLIVKH